MLLWINGPFGVGKTQVAYELHRRLPGSFVCDPEHLGFALHRMLPEPMRGDFQDLGLWRRGVREMLDSVARGFDGTVIVPMTVVDPAYHEEMVGALRASGHDVRHFALLARPETVRRRLRGRVMPLIRGDSWAVRQIDRCLEALRRPEFERHVPTDGLTVPDVADRIAREAGVGLRPSSDSRVTHYLRRQWVSAKHIRFD
ncbi:AAA family ATPase [Streptomyces sp. XD-27]|uniref:AAA family ATPase n=1 Tax=Streptomyces sp. XD-27 TaxID=3062779 RepID=UPI0026F40C16|nr:AAA family ATPase [Streptomyces sp. XD-27]WKX73133.1 AAA family ATPase [Streptomyces sp. XD-27]